MVRSKQLLVLAGSLFAFSVAGCDKAANEGGTDSAAEDDTGGADTDADADADADADGDTTDGGPVDSDEDGLTDEEEASLGTDPLKKDTDNDNYWDSWEVAEGTDPLDPESRIYAGYWPYNPNKDELEQGAFGMTSHNTGSLFPRASFLDQHGDMVDIYDFSQFRLNEEADQAYMIVDISAQWCGPCHNVANWIAGVDDANTEWVQAAYPTVREKVENYRIWWLTFIVQDVNQSQPTIADAELWAQTHQDSRIPVLVDDTQEVLSAYGAGAFPHFFLIDPNMAIEYFPPASAGSNENPYPAVGLVDTLL